MLPELAQVKSRRLKLGVKQGELAKLAGVSQSLIAKLESGRIEPSYANARRIFAALESVELGKQQCARDIMSRGVCSISEKDTVDHASRLMRSRNFSQLPVMHDQLVVGSISDKTLVDKINDGVDLKEIKSMRVKEIMDEAFPVVQEDTPLRAIYSLLEYSPALIVKTAGKMSGIISRSDLLRVR